MRRAVLAVPAVLAAAPLSAQVAQDPREAIDESTLQVAWVEEAAKPADSFFKDDYHPGTLGELVLPLSQFAI